MGEGDFRPSRPLDRFSWNLKYITTSRTRPRVQNFRGLCRREWSGQIARLTHESFCPFYPFLVTPQVAFLDTSQRSIRHYASFPPRKCSASEMTYIVSSGALNSTHSPPRKCLLGVRKIKFEIWPPLPPKNVKIGTLSWRSMEKSSRPNSGKVSRIMFKLGARIDLPSGITWHDAKVKRSKVKVTRAHNVYS